MLRQRTHQYLTFELCTMEPWPKHDTCSTSFGSQGSHHLAELSYAADAVLASFEAGWVLFQVILDLW